jgi:hypothetical protein
MKEKARPNAPIQSHREAATKNTPSRARWGACLAGLRNENSRFSGCPAQNGKMSGRIKYPLPRPVKQFLSNCISNHITKYLTKQNMKAKLKKKMDKIETIRALILQRIEYHTKALDGLRLKLKKLDEVDSMLPDLADNSVNLSDPKPGHPYSGKSLTDALKAVLIHNISAWRLSNSKNRQLFSFHQCHTASVGNTGLGNYLGRRRRKKNIRKKNLMVERAVSPATVVVPLATEPPP